MTAYVPTRTPTTPHPERAHPPHSPPRPPRRRFRVAGADVSAAIAVFLIALPLSLGIALATGAPLQAGLVAAAVGGLVAGRFGGAPLQVSGPAAGLTVVTADLIHRYGWRTTCAITVFAGLAQLGLGCLRVARSALAVSPAIVHGMLAGIGVTIAVAQVHIVLGGNPQSSVLDNLRALPAQLTHIRPAALAVSVLTLALLFLWPRLPGRAGRLLGKVPAALIAVTGATATAALAGLDQPRVDLPSWSSHALAGLPEGPVLGIVAAVLTTTLVCSVQSLLGAVAVDKLVAGRPALPARVGRSDLDRELLGQGAANVVSGALGGLPVAGVAVRSSANVRAGAVSRNSTMLHGVLVVVAALLMVPILEFIPLASLAALVMAVGIQMVSLHHIRTVTRHREVLVYAVTTLGVVVLGVLEGVVLGIAVAVAVSLHRLTRTRITHDELEGVHHVQVRGQLTFLAVPRLSRALHHVPQGSSVIVELDGSFMDHAAYEALQDWQRTHTARGGAVELTGRRAATRGKITELNSEAAAARTAPGSADPVDSALADCRCGPWTPWRNHQCEGERPSSTPTGPGAPSGPGASAAPAARTEHAERAGADQSTYPVEPVEPVDAAERPASPRPSALAEPTRSTERATLTARAVRTERTERATLAERVPQTGSAERAAPGSPAGQVRPEGEDSPASPPSGPGATGADRVGDAHAATHADADTRSAPATGSAPAADPTADDEPETDTTGPGIAQANTGDASTTGTDTGTGTGPVQASTAPPRSGLRLVRGISAFQRNTAPLVRGELARLAREGQQPSQLFLTCADSRLVTSMITSSGPGDLFVVRNVGNLVPPPGEESGDDSVAAAIEYAVDVLKVRSITVCGHSGCGAMQALLAAEPGGARTPLKRWLRHGRPSLERMADGDRSGVRLAGRAPADTVEQLCLTNVVQQLDHLRAHESVIRALRAGELELHGLYFHVGEAQTYLLGDAAQGADGEVFDHVGVADLRV
ncbi:SulP family inorganic anion transporter [Streptomyces sp. NPDC091281]|uniref:bifunctional SulP family inorganic anion transporter/carbonic anhydrase n=1 Tax=Streptomyces sp. NPDC091281 TaxID=3365985 RepID=UPI0038212C8A